MSDKKQFAGRYRDRAMIAYAKSEGADCTHRITHSYSRKYRDLKYVLLTERNRVAAVYRVQQDNSLRRLRRWPKPLNNALPKIKPKTRDEILYAVEKKFLNSVVGTEMLAEDLISQYISQVNELQCCEDHAHELGDLSPREIQEGIKLGYLKKPLSIDVIREYKARIGC